MNIFILDTDHEKCAQYHVDKHIVKMPLETAQILSTVLDCFYIKAPYKPTHKNHPCTIWAKQTKGNFIWLCDLGLALCKEYTYRYNKNHKCEEIINFCKSLSLDLPNQDGFITEFALAMPDNYKVKGQAVTSYRNYYNGDKKHLFSWKKRQIPEFIK